MSLISAFSIPNTLNVIILYNVALCQRGITLCPSTIKRTIGPFHSWYEMLISYISHIWQYIDLLHKSWSQKMPLIRHLIVFTRITEFTSYWIAQTTYSDSGASIQQCPMLPSTTQQIQNNRSKPTQLSILVDQKRNTKTWKLLFVTLEHCSTVNSYPFYNIC